MFFDVDRRQDVVLHQALGKNDGVFVVVTLPRHVGHEQVLAQCQLTVVCGRSISDEIALGQLVAFIHQRTLVDTSVLIRATELRQFVGLLAEDMSKTVFLSGLVVHDNMAAGYF